MATQGDGSLSLTKRCRLVGVARSTLYFRPKVTGTEELRLLRRMDELHLEYPFFGSRNMTQWLRREGLCVNRKRVQRLMRVLGIESLAPKPNLSKPNQAHVVYPYLLKNLVIERPNQVWATDITYIPLEGGHVYLVAVIDWMSRKVLSSRLSNTMDVSFCVEALEEALHRFGPPEIFNSDQGSQFTSKEFTEVLKGAGVKISMDGKGRCLDNVFVERLWRSLKYEDVYLKRYSWLPETKRGIAGYFEFFNGQRLHQGLGNKTPDEVYWGGLRTQRKKAV